MYLREEFRRYQDGRVVRALDLVPILPRPRGFESQRRRIFFNPECGNARFLDYVIEI